MCCLPCVAGLQEVQQLGLMRASVSANCHLQQAHVQTGAQPQCQVPVWLNLCGPVSQWVPTHVALFWHTLSGLINLPFLWRPPEFLLVVFSFLKPFCDHSLDLSAHFFVCGLLFFFLNHVVIWQTFLPLFSKLCGGRHLMCKQLSIG